MNESRDFPEGKAIGAISPGSVRRLLQNRVVILVGILIVYNLAFALGKPASFLSIDNYLSVLMNMSIESFIVIGMAILLISGVLDLSLGANMALTGILCGMLLKFAHFDVPAALLVSFAASLAMGAINGYFVAFLGVNPLITTLATAFVYQGIAVWLAGPGFTDFPDAFRGLGQSKLLGVQAPIWYMLGASAVLHILMSNFRFFRRFYFVGSSKRAATMSGLNTNLAVFTSFILASAFAGLGGIISASRYNTSMTSVGTGVELRAVTAAVIGGVSFTGGAGTVLGAILGSLFLAFLANGLIILGIEPSWQNVVVGVILILSIVVDVTVGKKD